MRRQISTANPDLTSSIPLDSLGFRLSNELDIDFAHTTLTPAHEAPGLLSLFDHELYEVDVNLQKLLQIRAGQRPDVQFSLSMGKYFI